MLRIWDELPKLSVVFWFAVIGLYLIGFAAVAAILNPAVNEFLQNANAPESVALKLNFFRLPLIISIMIAFPMLLWNSLYYFYHDRLPHAALEFTQLATELHAACNSCGDCYLH